ncbi:MAG: DinB family protein [Pseudomonadota bacterium]
MSDTDIALDEFCALRELTLDLLISLSKRELEIPSIGNVSPLWKQFRHIVRVQENYTEAIQTGVIVFDPHRGTCASDRSKASLLAYFESAQDSMISALKASTEQTRVDWFGEPCSVATHLGRLSNHESLHHGMFILQARERIMTLPPSWSLWGEHDA